jgi:adenine-specific DNA-methyltransferase
MSHFFHRRRSRPAVAPLPRNAVLHGDCIKVMAGLPDRYVDLVLTDPPYLVNYRDRAGRRVANDNNINWLAPAFAGIARLMKPEALCVSFYGWPHVDLFMQAWRQAGLVPVAHLVFPKRYASSVQLFASHHEQAYVLAKVQRPRVAKPISDILPWAYTGNQLHPTQKPVEALMPLVAALSKTGDLVLDPFAGSGSTLVAAHGLGRDYLGIDLDAGHVVTAQARLGLFET